MKDRKPFNHIKVFFRGPDGQEQEAGIILMGEFGSGFAYHKDYNGPSLDPVNLDYRHESSRRFPLRNTGRLHGVFEDCLPDGFAHKMLCHDEPKYAGMTDVERMFWLGSRTHGPFRFESMADVGNESPIRGEKKLEEIRRRVVAFHMNDAAFDGEKVMNKFNRFALTYDGGSHPKCLYEHVAVSAGQGGTRNYERTRWVAKFNVDSDVTNRAKVEGTMLEMSGACGINTPEVRIKTLAPSQEDVLMVRRFDEVDTEDGFKPLHKLSMCALTGIDNVGRSRARLGDYKDVLDAMKKISVDPKEDTEELFRRMLFHVAINNADNHFKNFEMLLTEEGWRLSPSFDTLPVDAAPGTAPFSTTVFGEAFPKVSQDFVFAQGRNFGLSRHRAAEIAKQVFEGCAKVDTHMDRFGVSPVDRARIHRAMPLEAIKNLAVAFRRISALEAANSLMIDEPERVVGAP